MDVTRLLLAGVLGSVLAAQDGAALLERVDRMRHPWPAFSVEVTLKDVKGEQRWRVRVRENGDSRVEGLSEKEKGRTVLLLGDEMWLLLPNARRPVKVSPAQRLLGPAAGGDLAHSRLSREYEVMGIHDEKLDGLACHRLELQARRAKLSYHTARFWIARATGFPIRVDYFLASGKPAKTLLFEAPAQMGAMFVVPALRLIDPTGSEGSLRFAHWKPGPQDAGLFVLPKAE